MQTPRRVNEFKQWCRDNHVPVVQITYSGLVQGYRTSYRSSNYRIANLNSRVRCRRFLVRERDYTLVRLYLGDEFFRDSFVQ